MNNSSRYRASFDPGPHGLISLLLVVATAGCSFTLVVPALPAIAEVTGAGLTTTAWILTGYLLASAIATPVLGRLGDVRGRRTMLAWTLFLMLAGSLVGAVSENIGALILARVLVGCGGGAVPLAMGIAHDEVVPRSLPGVVGLIGAASGMGSVVGLLASSPLMEAFGYRSLFWLPLILILLTGWSAARAAEAVRARRVWSVSTSARVGWAEHLLLAVWLTLPLVLLSSLDLGWSAPWSGTLLVATVVAYLGWSRLRPAREHVPRSRASTTLRLGNIVGMTMAAALFGSYALLPILAHADRTGTQVGVLEATYFLLPFEIGFLIASAVGGSLAAIAARTVVVSGGLTAALAFAGLSVYGGGHESVTLVTTGVLGATVGLTYPALALLILHATTAETVGASLALTTNLRTIGGALGTQLVGVLTVTPSGLAGDRHGVSMACAALCAMAGTGGILGLLLPPQSSGHGHAEPALWRC